MLGFEAALARVQSDYEFYVGCQTDPASTLGEYDLSPEETSALTDPDQLAKMLNDDSTPRAIRITISGTHDWVNRTTRRQPRQELQQPVVQEIAAIRAASSDAERRQAALKLIERIG